MNFRSCLTAFVRPDASRFGPLYLALLLFVGAATLTRLTLAVLYATDIGADWPSLFPAFLTGFAFDVYAALLLAIPYALFLLLMPNRWLAWRGMRWLTAVVYAAHLFALVYLCVADAVFFLEFTSRFNFVAVDYLAHMHEVAVNIRETYPVGKVLLADAVITLLLFVGLRRRLLASLTVPATLGQRARFAVGFAVPLVIGVVALNINVAQVSDNRIVNEIGNNGVYTFLYALTTNEVQYDALYAKTEDKPALERLHNLIATKNAQYLHPHDPYSIDRKIKANGPARRMNVVLLLEESLGSKFVPSLHPEGPSVMHEYDKLANESLFFTHIYATGNRTVRGLEASIIGLPPMPGRAVVKRASGTGLFTLSSVFKEKGYQTAFIYGGRSYFDNIHGFAVGNSFDRVIDQDDFKKITFTTIWGVCDEDLFDNALTDLDAMNDSGRPFFVTMLTVSNHTPYTYPAGRIPEDPEARTREHAMRYSDYALGKFMREARQHKFYDNTLFVILGDHGARVYGSQQIPLESYEIPVIFHAPKLIPKGKRVDMLGSQMDVGPTILGLLNFDYDSRFFGRDLLNISPDSRWALMSHNRDVALLRDDRLAVLGVRGVKEVWQYDRKTGQMRRLPDGSDQTLVNDAIAYYQSAARLYDMQRLARIAQKPIPANGIPANGIIDPHAQQ
ncbi:MAG: sulfatase-like hydrolase/transferase [Nitrosomonadales bacterium]|nr:sulfatase-like hydrolase/transferase [Nitrosomonadales bacterium]